MGQSDFCFPEASRWASRRGDGSAGRASGAGLDDPTGRGQSLVSQGGGHQAGLGFLGDVWLSCDFPHSNFHGDMGRESDH